MSKPWLRLWDKTLDSHKAQCLDGETFKGWVNLMCLANRQPSRGTLPGLESIAFSLRLTQRQASKLLDSLVKVGLIDRESGQLSMHDWDEWQPDYDSSTERTRAYRDRKKASDGDVTSRDVTVTNGDGHGDAPDTDTETEAETERESVCVSRTREGSDLKDWEEALASLQTTGDARAIGKQLRDWAQHPEISPVPAWKFVQAAHVVNEKPDKATWAFFMGVVRRASRREFEAWHDPPAHDPAFPAPKPRAAPTRSVPTVSDDQKAEIIRKLKERTARRDARCG